MIRLKFYFEKKCEMETQKSKIQRYFIFGKLKFLLFGKL